MHDQLWRQALVRSRDGFMSERATGLPCLDVWREETLRRIEDALATPPQEPAMQREPLTALLAELQGLMELEGFGCACAPRVQCGTCKARSILWRTLTPIIKKYSPSGITGTAQEPKT